MQARLDKVSKQPTNKCQAFGLNAVDTAEDEMFLEKIASKLRILCLEEELEERKRAIDTLNAIIVAKNQTIREREVPP
ncbi:hypothetical protein AAVH_13847 [Aphelenchoides avenae]|nr:hypothetical protein AAVH_13847 [Aphelenchus avenae]